jgi:DegV family protein with EDD domain
VSASAEGEAFAASVATAMLDGPRLAIALRAGAHRVAASQEQLNRINVFPVPDGDTGTNLTLTVSAILPALQQPPERADELLGRVADAAIDGARGNSGAILAQFLVGFAEGARGAHALDAPGFAAAVQRGAAYARESLSEPREGTVLTVLADFASSIRALVEGEGIEAFPELLARGLERAQASLQQTRFQLEALRRANVVDAGAQGFVELVTGISDSLNGREAVEATQSFAALPTAGEAVDTEHPFCTECVVTGPNIDRAQLRAALAALGNSVVVAGTADKARLHVHADDPGAVFRLAAEFGQVSARKADDIRKQRDAAHHARSHGVAVAVDSAADIPAEELDRLGIHMIPMRVHFGERSFLDKVSLSPEEFFRELATNPQHPKTSQPPPGDFRRTFEFLASHYETVVAITVTAGVSGTHAAAETAASRVQSRGRVIVIDSLNASLGEGLIAMYAAECATAGLPGEEVARRVRDIIPRTRTFGLLAALDFAVRGGRVPASVRTLARLLHLTPVLMTFRNGRVGAGSALFGRHRLRERFAQLVRRRIRSSRSYRVAVGHGQSPDEAQRLLGDVCAGLQNVKHRYLVQLGTALGVHGGPGMLVVAIQEYVPLERERSSP